MNAEHPVFPKVIFWRYRGSGLLAQFAENFNPMNRLRLLLSLALFVISCSTSVSVFSQQLSLFTQYREALTLINPAAPSNDFLAYQQPFSVGVSYRKQWNDLPGGPTTQVFRGSFLFETGGGVHFLTGGFLVNDQTGPTGFTGLYGRVAGLISGDPRFGGLIVGLSAGANQYRLNVSDIRLREEGDVLGIQDQNQMYPDVGVGIFGYAMLDGRGFEGDYLYGGISIPQVFGINLTFRNEQGEFFIERTQHYYAQLGMFKFFDNGGFLQPSVWVKYVLNAPINVDFNLRYQIAPPFWVGAGGSSGGAIHLETGFQIGGDYGYDNTLRIGYAFDYSFTTFGPEVGGTHEIQLTYSFDK